MPIPTCAVTCTFTNVEGAAIVGAEVVARLSRPAVFEGFVVPLKHVGTTDAAGQVVFDLWPNELDDSGTRYTISLRVDSMVVADFKIYVPKDTLAINAEDHVVDRNFEVPPLVIQGPKGDKGDPGDPGDAGDPGASAYDVAVANGFVGSEAQWLASLVGEGDPGLSAYQVALANGFVGTQPEWLESLAGEPGEKGDPGDPGVAPEDAAMIGKTVTAAGLRLGVIGASIEARAHPGWSVDAVDYQRIAGVVTLTFDQQIAD